MRKQWYKIGIALFFVLHVAVVNAQEKIAVIDLQRVFDQSNAALKEREKLKQSKDYNELVDKAKSLDAEIKSLISGLEKNNLTWSDKKKQENALTIQKKQKELNFLLNQRSAFLGQISNQIRKGIEPQVKKIIEGIVAAKSIDILLSAEATYFSKGSVDITQDVLTELNK